MEAEGHPTQILHVKDALKAAVEGDILFVGSPTRMGNMTRRTRKLLKSLDRSHWESRPVAAFDTEMAEVIEKDGASAAAKMHDLARQRGINVFRPVLKIGVKGIRGPLSADSGRLIEAYVKEFLAAALPKDVHQEQHRS